ncbi:hypothetical protein ACEQ6C_40500, partial [Rhizobium ruizarguesonis]
RDGSTGPAQQTGRMAAFSLNNKEPAMMVFADSTILGFYGIEKTTFFLIASFAAPVFQEK